VIRFARASARSVMVTSLAIGLAGVAAGAVRILPWLLDPSVPWPVAAPFARGLAAVAFESALLLGWPIGWSLACFRLVESGEALTLQTLGERPRTTVARLGWQGAAFAIVLGGIAIEYGRDASAPGRVATELLERARVSCAAVRVPTTYSVPFTSFTWLCVQGQPPRLVGNLPGPMSAAILTARDARIAGDFRAVELNDARVLLPGTPSMAVRVTSLAVRGMAPWAQASNVPPIVRAVVLALSACIAASLSAYRVLQGALRNRLGVLAFGAAGPLVALGLMRILERAGARPAMFAVVPLASATCTPLAAWLASLLQRLPIRIRAASTHSRV
jgi:hypothetical protein